MSEKKELNVEELIKVAGGIMYTNIKDINWLFSKNETVYVELTNGTKVEGKVTKRSAMGVPSLAIGYCTDCYYIESTINTIVNGWYLGVKFNNKTVSINDKFSFDLDALDW